MKKVKLPDADAEVRWLGGTPSDLELWEERRDWLEVRLEALKALNELSAQPQPRKCASQPYVRFPPGHRGNRWSGFSRVVKSREATPEEIDLATRALAGHLRVKPASQAALPLAE